MSMDTAIPNPAPSPSSNGLSPLPSNSCSTSMATSALPARKRSIGDVDMDEAVMDNNTHTTTDVEVKMDGAADAMSYPNDKGSLEDNKENQDTRTKSCGSVDEKSSGGSLSASASGADLTPSASHPIAAPAGTSAAAMASPAAKKRKLSPASKEAKQQEKEAKERQKLEEKAKKEEEKAKKEEEKAKKEEEKRKREAEKEEEKRAKEEEKKKREAEKEEERKKKEEKRKAKEEEKAAKEEEKRKKDEEKSKKERAQMKLNSFFAKPKTPAQPSISNTTPSPSKPKSTGAGASNYPPPESGSAASDYQREFPDFFLQSHTTVAPSHRFQRNHDALHHMREKVDACLKSANEGLQAPLIFRPSEIFQIMPYKRRCGKLPASVKEILLQMQSLADHPEMSDGAQEPRDLLKQVKMKSLRFNEDVRPPYQGTYSRSLPESSARRMMRNPFRRELPDTDYDYDSEAEWEEPEEGEDLDSEEEEEGSEDGEDDMDGFLDDEDDHPIDGKRRLIVGDLEPVNTGIRWQEHGVDPELQVYRMETISDSVTFPIDPFSTAYWQKPRAAEPAPAAGLGRSTLHAFMGHPSSHKASGSVPAPDGGTVAVLTTGRTKRTLPPEQLAEFKQVVNGSDLTKMGLIEILKKR
ncbi:hypothetical protein BO94DRAFT_546605 [Aspergillus sclerotioniger CBS 115572]|uniref:Chromatin assembly factor 1 subunit A n=1 Tax=Aspergillus sclerotioniger CBS 115572 TaxID=1450535 RepID=A0A317WM12_9EURO|nr:hypothetical protein BO94DRAFT_546605 [Aspergillus sclerotioniger CBS 115572]PWY86362.1 hypothetical protein BO94DRAFT_546605 [Aspergillus sclerotioniger CBS 115572]